MTSQIGLEVVDTRNVKTLRVLDSSFYNAKIKVECGTLEVTPPGYNNPVIFNVTKDFSIVLNSSNLKLAKVKVYSKLQALPDGVYKLKYSIKPNDDLWVTYDHLRVSKLLRDYYQQLCALKLQACEPDSDTRSKIKKLREIRIYIDAAVAEVEECGNRGRGLELYDYAQKLLNKFKTTDCPSC